MRALSAILAATALASCIAIAGTANAGSVTGGDHQATGLLPNPADHSNPIAAAYDRVVDRKLVHLFGPGPYEYSRTLFCDGPTVVGFQIMPDGRVANVRMLTGDETAIATLLRKARFPPLPAGLNTAPRDEFYRYGLAAFNRPFLAVDACD